MIEQKMTEIAETMKADIIQSVAQEVHLANHRFDVKRCMQDAETIVNRYWVTFDGKMSLVNGKGLLTELNRWTQLAFAVSFTNARLATDLLEDEMHDEVRQTLTAIEFNEPLR